MCVQIPKLQQCICSLYYYCSSEVSAPLKPRLTRKTHYLPRPPPQKITNERTYVRRCAGTLGVRYGSLLPFQWYFVGNRCPRFFLPHDFTSEDAQLQNLPIDDDDTVCRWPLSAEGEYNPVQHFSVKEHNPKFFLLPRTTGLLLKNSQLPLTHVRDIVPRNVLFHALLPLVSFTRDALG